MKFKILSLAALFSCSLILVNAQSPTFQKGDKVINLGIGLGGYSPSGYKITTPSVSASFEYGIADNIVDKASIGIGGYVGYANYYQKGSYYYNNYWSVNRIMVGARGVLHYPFIDKLDTYGGITIGFAARSWKWNGPVNRTDYPKKSPFTGDLLSGGRYYFSDKIAAMGELGLGAFLTLGISLKL